MSRAVVVTDERSQRNLPSSVDEKITQGIVRETVAYGARNGGCSDGRAGFIAAALGISVLEAKKLTGTGDPAQITVTITMDVPSCPEIHTLRQNLLDLLKGGYGGNLVGAMISGDRYQASLYGAKLSAVIADPAPKPVKAVAKKAPAKAVAKKVGTIPAKRPARRPE